MAKKNTIEIILLNSLSMLKNDSCSYFLRALMSSSSFKSGLLYCNSLRFWLLLCSICSPYCKRSSLLSSFGPFSRFSLIEALCWNKFGYSIMIHCQISIDASVRNRRSLHSMDSYQCFGMVTCIIYLHQVLATLRSIVLSTQSQGIGVV